MDWSSRDLMTGARSVSVDCWQSNMIIASCHTLASHDPQRRKSAI